MISDPTGGIATEHHTCFTCNPGHVSSISPISFMFSGRLSQGRLRLQEHFRGRGSRSPRHRQGTVLSHTSIPIWVTQFSMTVVMLTVRFGAGHSRVRYLATKTLASTRTRALQGMIGEVSNRTVCTIQVVRSAVSFWTGGLIRQLSCVLNYVPTSSTFSRHNTVSSSSRSHRVCYRSWH